MSLLLSWMPSLKGEEQKWMLPSHLSITALAVSSDPRTAEETSSLTSYPFSSIMSQLLSENSSSLRLTKSTPTDVA